MQASSESFRHLYTSSKHPALLSSIRQTSIKSETRMTHQSFSCPFIAEVFIASKLRRRLPQWCTSML